MCGRYSITLPPEAIREIFQTHGELPNWPAYYNAAPTTALPVVRQATEGNRELVLKPANEDVLVSRPVNNAAGNVKNNGPELLA